MIFTEENTFYLSKCNSTQDEIKDFLENRELMGVYSFNQTQGRGQLGNEWKIESGKNIALTMGIKKNKILFDSVALSMFVANVLRAFLKEKSGKKTSIKWPNDIIIENKKVSGILIETFQEYYLIGIGMNINQTDFEHLPNASSLFNFTQETYDLQLFTQSFLEIFENSLECQPEEILPLYNHFLYKKNDKITWKIENKIRVGNIHAVNSSGEIGVKLEDNSIQYYKHKAIEILDWFEK